MYVSDAGVVNGDRSKQQQLLQQYAAAVLTRDAHALSAYTSTALLNSGVQRGLAMRIIAGVFDANTYMLHDLAPKLVTSAQSSRCAVVFALSVTATSASATCNTSCRPQATSTMSDLCRCLLLLCWQCDVPCSCAVYKRQQPASSLRGTLSRR